MCLRRCKHGSVLKHDFKCDMDIITCQKLVGKYFTFLEFLLNCLIKQSSLRCPIFSILPNPKNLLVDEETRLNIQYWHLIQKCLKIVDYCSSEAVGFCK